MDDVDEGLTSLATMLRPDLSVPRVELETRARRVRRRRRATVTGIASVVALVFAVVVVSTRDRSGTGQVRTISSASASSSSVTVPREQWTTYRDAAHGLSIAFPPNWQAASSTLTPVLADPIVPIAVGTYRLDPQKLGECDIVPQRALEALGPSDAFIAVYLYQGSATFDPQLQRPAHFTVDVFPPSQMIQCTENVHGSVRTLGFLDQGRKLSVLVAVGANATPETQSEVYDILDTLVVDPLPR